MSRPNYGQRATQTEFCSVQQLGDSTLATLERICIGGLQSNAFIKRPRPAAGVRLAAGVVHEQWWIAGALRRRVLVVQVERVEGARG
jgi:hypothetical protein